MSVDTLLTRYSLSARAGGLSPKTVSHVRLGVRLFADFLGGIPDVRKITADDLRRFIIALQQRPKWQGMPQADGQTISATAVNTYTRAVKSFWSWLNREGIIKDNPLAAVPAPKLPRKLPKVLSEGELAVVFKACLGNDRDTAIVQLLADSGMRLGELVNLDFDDFDGKGNVLRVRGKTGERPVFITNDTQAAIALYCFDERPEPVAEDKLFLTHDGRPLTASRVQKILEGIGKRAGLGQRLGPHKIRHSVATMMLRNGANLETVRRTLGHTQISTTERYLHLTDRDIAEAHKQFSPVTNLLVRKSK